MVDTDIASAQNVDSDLDFDASKSSKSPEKSNIC